VHAHVCFVVSTMDSIVRSHNSDCGRPQWVAMYTTALLWLLSLLLVHSYFSVPRTWSHFHSGDCTQHMHRPAAAAEAHRRHLACILNRASLSIDGRARQCRIQSIKRSGVAAYTAGASDPLAPAPLTARAGGLGRTARERRECQRRPPQVTRRRYAEVNLRFALRSSRCDSFSSAASSASSCAGHRPSA
jgi:hypothetical protein